MGQIQGYLGRRGEQVSAYEKKEKGNKNMVDDKEGHEIDQKEKETVEVLHH